ncbi:hypothetical protein NDU88_000449 [Pleurodeles waltl]|uniref:Uncharacterized protein n=1 Tax=Pleurodeles waltl TaxID=8319 RepID=A0AAV7N9J5_PLEWA|nr:hypothetical protein NDU88_000449 [Pleurodeles waltl]
MAGYEDQTGDEYYMDDSAASFEQDLVYALDAGVRHTVNQALAQAIRPIKHHLLGFAEQQGWVPPLGVQAIEEPSLSGGSQSVKQSSNPHVADFESLIRAMAKEYDYKASSSQKVKSREDLVSSSSDHSSDQGKNPPRKRKKKSHHQEEPLLTPKVITVEPEDIVHPDLHYGCPLQTWQIMWNRTLEMVSIKRVAPGCGLSAPDRISPLR